MDQRWMDQIMIADGPDITVLHLLEFNYRDLAFERHGLKERLTDRFSARVVKEIIA